MTSTKLLETPAVAQAVVGSMPCCIVDARDRITEVNDAFATRLNRAAAHLVGVEILDLMRSLSVDESRSTGANCFHLREANKDSWIRDASVPQTPAVDDLVKLPRVITGMRFTWGFVIAVVVGLVLYYVLFWTSGGFKLRAVGYNMTASRFNGIPVKRYILTSFIISGAIAGLGGGAELLGTQFRLINGFGAGYGFDGVAMALIGQLHPIATMVVALFFAVLRVGSTTMQAATGVPTSVSDIIQALVIVFSVAGMALTKLPEFQSWKSRVFGKRKAGAV